MKYQLIQSIHKIEIITKNHIYKYKFSLVVPSQEYLGADI